MLELFLIWVIILHFHYFFLLSYRLNFKARALKSARSSGVLSTNGPVPTTLKGPASNEACLSPLARDPSVPERVKPNESDALFLRRLRQHRPGVDGGPSLLHPLLHRRHPLHTLGHHQRRTGKRYTEMPSKFAPWLRELDPAPVREITHPKTDLCT